MFFAALFFFGIAAFIVGALVCLSIGKLLKVNNVATFDKKQTLDRATPTTWEELKAAFRPRQ